MGRSGDIDGTGENRYLCTPMSDTNVESGNATEPSGNEPQENGSPRPLLLLMRVIATPLEGWKALKRAHVPPERMASSCFYPLLALTAASCFANFIYDPYAELTGTLTEAVVEFVKFFLGYFAVLWACKMLPEEIRYRMEMPFGRNFVMVAMSSLVIWSVLLQWLPMAAPVLSFLPLYTVYMIFKGVKFLRIPENRLTLTASVLSVMTIVAPYIIGILFNLLLPTAKPEIEP